MQFLAFLCNFHHNAKMLLYPLPRKKKFSLDNLFWTNYHSFLFLFFTHIQSLVYSYWLQFLFAHSAQIYSLFYPKTTATKLLLSRPGDSMMRTEWPILSSHLSGTTSSIWHSTSFLLLDALSLCGFQVATCAWIFLLPLWSHLLSFSSCLFNCGMPTSPALGPQIPISLIWLSTWYVYLSHSHLKLNLLKTKFLILLHKPSCLQVPSCQLKAISSSRCSNASSWNCLC